MEILQNFVNFNTKKTYNGSPDFFSDFLWFSQNIGTLVRISCQFQYVFFIYDKLNEKFSSVHRFTWVSATKHVEVENGFRHMDGHVGYLQNQPFLYNIVDAFFFFIVALT